MTLSLKTHINIAKDLICLNIQEKDRATKPQNAMKHEDFFFLIFTVASKCKQY